MSAQGTEKGGFAALLSASLLLSAFLGGCADAETLKNSGSDSGKTEQATFQPQESVYTLMGIAAYKSFDAPAKKAAAVVEKTKLPTSSDADTPADADSEAFQVSYPFDSLKILSAVKFSAAFPETPDLLKTYCGEGELEYVIAEFETYVDNGSGVPLSDIRDTLLAVRGSKGYYCSLSNSYQLG